MVSISKIINKNNKFGFKTVKDAKNFYKTINNTKLPRGSNIDLIEKIKKDIQIKINRKKRQNIIKEQILKNENLIKLIEEEKLKNINLIKKTKFNKVLRELQFENEYKKLVEKKRIINTDKKTQAPYIINQNPLIKIDNSESVTFDGKKDMLYKADIVAEIINNKFAYKFSKDYINCIKREYYKLIKDVNFYKMIVKTMCLVQTNIPYTAYKSIDFHGDEVENEAYYFKILHSKGSEFNRNNGDTAKINLVGAEDSQSSVIVIGFKILLFLKPGKEKLSDNTIQNLKAYDSSNNIKFHEYTSASTGHNLICIYETFLHTIGKKNLKYMRKKDKNDHDKIMKELKNEGEEIEKNVKKGNLILSLELLTKKYEKDVLIVFFQNKITEENIFDKKPIEIIKGETKIIDDMNYLNEKYKNKEIFLYEQLPNNKGHVGPAFFNKVSTKFNDKKENKNLLLKKGKTENYKLRKIKLTKNRKIIDVLGYDCETKADLTNEGTENEYIDAKPGCLCISGKLNGIKVEESFYGDNIEKKFVDYLLKIRTRVNDCKTRPKHSIRNIHIYGFNNSNFDNIFFYMQIKNAIPYTEIIFASGGIKQIKFDNIRILDISLIYKNGGLRKTAESFKLEKEKGVYPYRFFKTENLYYKGKAPGLEYWNEREEYEEYIKLNGDYMDVEAYTKKYCMLDAELAYELSNKHLESAVGVINGKYYDVRKCATSANVAIKMFQQVFMDMDYLEQSIDAVVKKERDAYYGGRTEVFKKNFKQKNGSLLYYYDINSSYPSSMTKLMPYKYLRTETFEEYKVDSIDDITDYYLYKANSKYIGKNIYNIPNLLRRDEKGNIITKNNTDYGYHWGIELKEAIKNEYEIKIMEVMIYEGQAIFKEFTEYFYKKRLECKKTNLALANFCKSNLNSLYGKFAQKLFEQAILCEYSEMSDLFNSDLRIITDWRTIEDKLLISYKESGDDKQSIGNLVRFSSYIAGCSRSNLSEMMRHIGYEHIYYCDTDSIFTDKKPDDLYISDDILGKWKLEDNVTDATFLGKKFYQYETLNKKEIKKCKGIDAKKMNKQDYEDLLLGIKEKYEDKRNIFFRSYEGVKIKNVSRNVEPIYNKRIWEGNNSKPLE
jgi:hypothetical protein